MEVDIDLNRNPLTGYKRKRLAAEVGDDRLGDGIEVNLCGPVVRAAGKVFIQENEVGFTGEIRRHELHGRERPLTAIDCSEIVVKAIDGVGISVDVDGVFGAVGLSV